MKNEKLRWAVGLVCLALLAYAFYLVFSPFFGALTWAVILAILLSPVYSWLGRWIPWRGWRALVTCLLAAAIILGPAAALGTMLVGELVSGLQYVQVKADQMPNLDPSTWGIIGTARDWIEARLIAWLGEPRYRQMTGAPDLGATVVSASQSLSQWLLNQSSAIFRNLAQMAFTMVVTMLTLFYLLRDGDRALEAACELLPYPSDRKQEMLDRLNQVVVTSVYGGMAVAAAQGILGGLAFAVIGLPSPVLWGTVMAVMAFLPLVGATAVWGPAAIILAIQGRWIAAMGLAIWGILAVGLIDNLLRPVLISGRTEMHPLLVFLAVLGGIQAFGFLGLFLGPVLVAVVTGLVDLYRGMMRGEFAEEAGGEKVAG
ncbi:MAG: AI-2E family transporter [Acidobacteriota bacterium]